MAQRHAEDRHRQEHEADDERPEPALPADGGQPPEKPEGSEPPADGQEPPEKPEGDESLTPPSDGRQLPEKPEGNASVNSQQLSEDDENLFNLFRQFLNWLKGNTEE